MSLSEPYVFEYAYKRSTGPVVGRFLSALRDGRIEGVRTASGRILVPPTEYDPQDGSAVTDEWVTLSGRGEVKTWTWVDEPRPQHPLDRPFGWALIALDGADTAMLHAVDTDPHQLKTGLRVRADFREARTGLITDIRCFIPENA